MDNLYTVRILAAFWQPLARRFCELTADEIRSRAGLGAGTLESGAFRQLVQHKVILYHVPTDSRPLRIYRLAPEGERRVSAMVVTGKLPRTGRRLTAVPQEKRA